MIFRIFNGIDPVLHVSDPILIQVILVKHFDQFTNRRQLNTYHEIVNTNIFQSRDEQWKKLRNVTRSMFTGNKLREAYESIGQCVEEFVRYLEQIASKDSFDTIDTYEKLTLEVITRFLFRIKCNSIGDNYNQYLDYCQKNFDFKPKRIIASLALPKTVNDLLGIKSHADEQGNQFIINVVRKLIEQRRQSETTTQQKEFDFLQLLIDSERKDQGNF